MLSGKTPLRNVPNSNFNGSSKVKETTSSLSFTSLRLTNWWHLTRWTLIFCLRLLKISPKITYKSLSKDIFTWKMELNLNNKKNLLKMSFWIISFKTVLKQSVMIRIRTYRHNRVCRFKAIRGCLCLQATMLYTKTQSNPTMQRF